MNSDNSTFYFVRFPLGGGGNHLANLISLDASFGSRIPGLDKELYQTELIKTYNKSNLTGHLSTQLHIHDHQWIDIVDQLDSKSNSVYTGHACSFIWGRSTLNSLKNKRYILLTFKSDKSMEILKKRELAIFNTSSLENSYYAEEIRYLYNGWIQEDNQIADDINLEIEISELFQDNINDLLSKINKKFNLNIPHNTAKELHDEWINKNKGCI